MSAADVALTCCGPHPLYVLLPDYVVDRIWVTRLCNQEERGVGHEEQSFEEWKKKPNRYNVGGV